jgi:hypothetical protein
MNGLELLKKMRSNDECWRIFTNYVQNKEESAHSRLTKLDHVFHKEKVPGANSSPPTKGAQRTAATPLGESTESSVNRYASGTGVGEEDEYPTSYGGKSSLHYPPLVIKKSPPRVFQPPPGGGEDPFNMLLSFAVQSNNYSRLANTELKHSKTEDVINNNGAIYTDGGKQAIY